MDARIVHWPATDEDTEQTFYFASEDGETFRELTRLPLPGEGMPPTSEQFTPMTYASRYFRQIETWRPGVRVEEVTISDEAKAPSA